MKTNKELSAKDKILNAALSVIRTRGYVATTVDDLCHEAGVTKGAFFHHFKSKEDLAIAAAKHWSEVTDEVFAKAPYRQHADPLDRLLGYIDFRKFLLRGEVPEFTCLVGTMVQEVFDTNPAIRDACRASIFGHAADVSRDIAEAKKLYAPKATWSAEGLGLHIQAVIQGSFILSKADDSSTVALDSISHLRRYLEFLFDRNQTASKPKEKK